MVANIQLYFGLKQNFYTIGAYKHKAETYGNGIFIKLALFPSTNVFASILFTIHCRCAFRSLAFDHRIEHFFAVPHSHSERSSSDFPVSHAGEDFGQIAPHLV